MINPSPSKGAATPALLSGLAVIAVLVAACSAGGAGASPSPSAPASPVPSGSPVASPSPSEPGAIVVDLDVVTGHDVSVVVDDKSGKGVKFASGRGGDGMSVRWGDSKVENVDADTIRVTWVGLPRDEELKLTVSGDSAALELAFEQAAPPADSDAIGHDRVLVIDFAEPVNAEDVEVSFSEA